MAVLGKNDRFNLHVKWKFLLSSSLGWLEVCSMKVRERRVLVPCHAPSPLLSPDKPVSDTPAGSGAWRGGLAKGQGAVEVIKLVLSEPCRRGKLIAV